jgi:peptide chain release factor 1
MLKESLLRKLKNLGHRYIEIGGLLSDTVIISDQDRYRELSREYAQLEPIITAYNNYQETKESWIETQDMLAHEKDSELKSMIQNELQVLNEKIDGLSKEITISLLPSDPRDAYNVFLEIRAGTGGMEAALFAGVLFRMYMRFAEKKKWKLSIISSSDSEQGGYKEIIARVSGTRVYSQLKFESGVHRVQRVPTTESQGRVHTSACTVAVLPEIENIEEVIINPSDLRVDTFRASGAGGQHVNKTDSAVRLTHLPTGVVVECQDERSQHKNKARAMSLLASRLLAAEQDKQQKEQAQERRSLVGSGDRSERIRTYNFPQGRVTDHRINLTLYKLDEIVDGDLAPVIDPLVQELQADQLAALGDD